MLENISSVLWRRICGRLLLIEKKLTTSPRVVPRGIEFVYDSSKPLGGVIAHLTLECGGNVHDQGIVNVTASSYPETAKNAVDLGTDSHYISHGEMDPWICYDFKRRRVIPTSYSVRSSDGFCHIKSWVIEVSNDGSSWTEIDRRDNNNDLHGKYATANFRISMVPSEGIRFFRLRQIGWGNCIGLARHRVRVPLQITSLEIFDEK